MSETATLLGETARRIFARHHGAAEERADDAGAPSLMLLREIEQAGLLDLMLPESQGGAGLGIAESAAVWREAGLAAAPAPVAEMMLDRWHRACHADSRLDLVGAAAMAVQMAAASEAALAIALDHARLRQQFGKPIGAFQAVQHALAEAAGHAAAARVAADAAIAALASDDAFVTVAAAKIRAGEAAGTVAAVTHQVLGATGATREHPLHRYTFRLQHWRSKFGTEAEWSAALGKRAAGWGPEGLWDGIVKG